MMLTMARMMNTSIVLPPVSWNLATLEIPSKSKEKVRSKDSHRSRASSNSSSKGSERKRERPLRRDRWPERITDKNYRSQQREDQLKARRKIDR